MITPARPTSEPVPAVVGTATTGAIPAGSARVHQSPTSSKSHIGRVCPRMKAMTLPASSAEPPPKAITPSCPPARSTSSPSATLASVGLGWTSEKTAASSPASRERLQRALGDGQRHDAGVGDEERPRDPGGAGGGAQLGDAPGAEADGGGIVPVRARDHAQSFRR